MATLVHPDGRTYTTDSPTEITRLVAQGYTVRKPAKKPVQKSEIPQKTPASGS